MDKVRKPLRIVHEKIAEHNWTRTINTPKHQILAEINEKPKMFSFYFYIFTFLYQYSFNTINWNRWYLIFLTSGGKNGYFIINHLKKHNSK